MSARYPLHPLRVIASVERKVIVRSVWWLTLECGHRVRIAGPTPPKKRARCFHCHETAEAAAVVYYAACYTCGDDATTPGYAHGQHRRVRISLRLRNLADARADVDEHLAAHAGHRASVMREADLAAAALGVQADAVGAAMIVAPGRP